MANPKQVPEGFELLTCASELWFNKDTGQLVVLGSVPEGWPEEAHDCDLMGCSSVGYHVLMVFCEQTQ